MTREELEARLVRKLSAALADQFRSLRELLETSTSPSDEWWREQGQLLEEALIPTLEELAIAGHYAVIPAKAIPVLDAIRDWLLVRGVELIRDLTDTSRAGLEGALADFFSGGVTLQELTDSVSEFFGVDRALRIAVTEATRAYDLGDQLASEELRELGLEVKDVWNAHMDSLVDEDCAERDGLESADWPTPQRPPLHPNCRCWITHPSMFL